MNEKNTIGNDMPGLDDLDLNIQADDLDLFSEELEDRFNADAGSSLGSASTLKSCFGSLSSLCCWL